MFIYTNYCTTNKTTLPVCLKLSVALWT